jgi:hypothetical protein
MIGLINYCPDMTGRRIQKSYQSYPDRHYFFSGTVCTYLNGRCIVRYDDFTFCRKISDRCIPVGWDDSLLTPAQIAPLLLEGGSPIELLGRHIRKNFTDEYNPTKEEAFIGRVVSFDPSLSKLTTLPINASSLVGLFSSVKFLQICRPSNSIGLPLSNNNGAI